MEMECGDGAGVEVEVETSAVVYDAAGTAEGSAAL